MSSRDKVDLKVVVLGDSGVGKTCILVRFLDDSFGVTQGTIGASYFKKTVAYNNLSFSLGLWDTAGQERYDSLSLFYCRGAGCALIIFDITNRESFQNLTKWHDKLTSATPDPNYFWILLGAKLDSVKNDGTPRQVLESEGHEIARKMGAIRYIETSAKTGENIKEAFAHIVEKYAHQVGQTTGVHGSPTSVQSVNVGQAQSSNPSQQGKGCC